MMSVSDFICHIITIIIMQTIFIYNYGNMTEQKADINLKYYFTVVITSLLVFVNNFYNLLMFRFLTGLIINSLTAISIYKERITRTFYYSVIHAIISLIVELFLSLILMFNIENVNILNRILYAKIIFSLVLGIITIIIFKNKKILNFINKTKRIFNSNIIIIIIPLVLIFINTLAVFRVIDFTNIFMLILSMASVIFMILSIKVIINEKYNIKIVEEKIKNLKESHKAYSKTIDDCRELKHNLRNDLLTLKSGLNKDSQDKINEIIIKYNNNYEWINMIDEIPEGLQGLIYLKQKESENKKVKLFINTINNFKTNNKDYIDLCSILSILIDNAIDASKIAKSKVIEINFKETNNYLNIRIINNYINSIDLNKIGKKNYSTKEYKSGLGLNFVNKINNPKLKVNFKIINDLFITDIYYAIKN